MSLQALREPWPRAVCRLLEESEDTVVRILVAEVRGSSPREPGTCMLVTRGETYGSIGGGNLEWQAVGAAARLLTTPGEATVQFPRFVLGRELGQCCGGVVQLWVERFSRTDLPDLRRWAFPESGDAALLTEVTAQGVTRRLLSAIAPADHLQFTATSEYHALLEPLATPRPALWLYGAGHVGQALVHILGELPFAVTWIDSRSKLFPRSVPDNVHPVCSSAPIDTVGSAPDHASYLVMTHDHALDYALCRRILEHGRFAWLGLIGSKSKGARFRSRLAHDGIAPGRIARLTCPIGIDGVDSKLPAAIAVAVAAQLLGADAAAERSVAPFHEVTCSSPDCAACSTQSSIEGHLAS